VTRELVRVRVKTHYYHVVGRRLGGIEYDVILPRPRFDNGAALPQRLTFEASWIYDLTDHRILKNKTGKSVVPCIDAEEVDGTWLSENNYTVHVNQPGHDMR
jgi:hypothetical protein